MFKVIVLFTIGFLLLAEGYFYFVRGLLPVAIFSEFHGEEFVYMKAVNVEGGFNYDIVFYAFGVTFNLIALFLLNKLKGRDHK
jgi:hypothetical protein